MDMTHYTREEIERRMFIAEQRYGPFASTHEALGVASEEWDELRDAVRANDLNAIKHECVDLVAVLLRLIQNINQNENLRNRSTK